MQTTLPLSSASLRQYQDGWKIFRARNGQHSESGPFRWKWLACLSMFLSSLLIVGALTGTPAIAESKAITVSEALGMLSALRNLDGRVLVVKQNGVDTPVTMPWEFGSGMLRLRIAKNLTTLTANEKAVEDSRQNIVKEILKSLPPNKDGIPPSAIPPGTPQWDDFMRQYNDILSGTASVTGLFRIKASELKLDKNEIPISVLSALSPILDDDISVK